MSQFTADYHVHRGLRMFEQGEWDAASHQFALAYHDGGKSVRTDMFASWAQAVLRSSSSWEEKIATLVTISDRGYRNPAFWALALQAYLQVLDRYDGRDSDESHATRRFMLHLRNIVADCVDVGTSTFRNLAASGSPAAYAWGAALVSAGDGLYAFKGSEAGISGRFPYRPIAETLYLPVAQMDLSSLFADAETQREISEKLTCRARMQINRMAEGPTIRPSRAGRNRLDPSGWTLFALRSMS